MELQRLVLLLRWTDGVPPPPALKRGNVPHTLEPYSAKAYTPPGILWTPLHGIM